MQNSDEYKRQILKRMGVDIWQLRVSSKHHSASSGSLDFPDVAEKTGVDSNDLVVDKELQSPERTSATLDSLANEIKSCVRCHLHQTRSNTVPGEGNNQADWMFIGEVPGRSEDEQGLPFSGKTGKLLDAMLVALGMNRNGIFVTNILKCRSRENSDSLSEEMTLCSEFIQIQIELIQPKIIIAMGERSAQKLLSITGTIDSLRQQVHHYGSSSIPLIATFDLGYLMKFPEEKGKAWSDLLLARTSYQASLNI